MEVQCTGDALEEDCQSLQERGFTFTTWVPRPGLFILLRRTRFPCGLISCSADLLVMNSFNFFESVYLALLLRDIFSGYKILC